MMKTEVKLKAGKMKEEELSKEGMKSSEINKWSWRKRVSGN